MERFKRVFVIAISIILSSVVLTGKVFARDFDKRFDQALNGMVVSASNVLITCDTAHPECSGAQNLTGPLYQNGPFSMVNVDTDDDPATFNSSSANINFAANSTVVFAGLYWGGQFGDFGAPYKNFVPPNPEEKATIKLKGPDGDYVSVTGTTDEEGDFYQGFAEVTELISGPGQYTVADAQLSTGKQMNGGWTLVVVVKTPLEPLRRVVIWDGFLRHGVGNLGFSLPETLGTRTADSSIAMNLISYDGDKGASDSLRIDGNLLIPNNFYPTTDPASSGDIGNSTIRTMGVRNEDRNPSFINTLGYDADVFEISSYVNSDYDLELIFSTTGDIKHVGLITVQSDVEERFVQTDWSTGVSAGTSDLLDLETGFLNRSGHVFHDTAPGNLRSVQFSYEYNGGLYEMMPIRSNSSDATYIDNWHNDSNAYPTQECNQTQFWLYREVDTSRVSWMYGANGSDLGCKGRLRASYDITGAFSAYDSIGNQSTPTGFKSFWKNYRTAGHYFRFSDREFRIDGNLESRANNTIEHSVVIDENGTEVPFDWNNTRKAPWALASDFNGRLESKVFDAQVPRGFGELKLDYTQTNNSMAQVFFRAGDTEADVLSESWEGPFEDGDTLGSLTNNNKRFFQYAIVTTLTDPSANTVESELVVKEIAFNFYSVNPFTKSTAGTWKRIEEQPFLFNPEQNFGLAVDHHFDAEFDDNMSADSPDANIGRASMSCSSTGQTTIPSFALLLLGFFVGRRRKKK